MVTWSKRDEFSLIIVGKRSGGHGDSRTGTHPCIWVLAHIRFATISATHPRIFCRVESPFGEALDGVEVSPDRGRGLSPLREFTSEATSDVKASRQ
jgi:hypothetical protein